MRKRVAYLRKANLFLPGLSDCKTASDYMSHWAVVRMVMFRLTHCLHF